MMSFQQRSRSPGAIYHKTEIKEVCLKMMKRILAVVRILVGALFLSVSIKKFGDAGFFEPEGLARELSQNGIAFPFYQAILDRYILPHATVFSYLVATGELIVGLSF